jgi:hypothetical protein
MKAPAHPSFIDRGIVRTGIARYRLGKLRLQPNERALIEQQLARRVPLPQQAAE